MTTEPSEVAALREQLRVAEERLRAAESHAEAATSTLHALALAGDDSRYAEAAHVQAVRAAFYVVPEPEPEAEHEAGL